MVIYEDYIEPGIHIDMERAYSDQGFKIEHAGIFYDEAINFKYLEIRYNETDIKIGSEINAEHNDETLEYAEAGKILLGVKE